MTLDGLRELAERATPGPRTVEDGESWELYAGRDADHHGYKLIKAPTVDEYRECYWPSPADSAYIAACSPEVIKALVAVAEAARGMEHPAWCSASPDHWSFDCPDHRDAAIDGIRDALDALREALA